MPEKQNKKSEEKAADSSNLITDNKEPITEKIKPKDSEIKTNKDQNIVKEEITEVINPSKQITAGIDGVVMLGVEMANVFQRRYEFAPMLDATLYNSADSYSATRNVFLQTKKEFDIDDNEVDVFDPYGED